MFSRCCFRLLQKSKEELRWGRRGFRGWAAISAAQPSQSVHNSSGSHSLTLRLSRNRSNPFATRLFSVGPNNESDGEQDKTTSSQTPTIWNQLKSPPNLITLTRLASTPLLAHWIISENYEFAIGGCILAGISDAADGYLAKRFGWATTVGTYLDPLADKILINTLGVSLWYSGLLPTPVIMIWATKDVLLLSGTGWFVYQQHQSFNFFATSLTQKPLKVAPSRIGKMNTAFQFVTLGVGIVTPIAVGMNPAILESLCWITGLTTVAAILSYTDASGLLVERDDDKKKRS